MNEKNRCQLNQLKQIDEPVKERDGETLTAARQAKGAKAKVRVSEQTPLKKNKESTSPNVPDSSIPESLVRGTVSKVDTMFTQTI